MPRLAEKLLLLVAIAAAHAGCKPKIGDDCKISTDCSAAGDRLCDITAPGGYCTVFGCEPGTCPEDESLCVEFGEKRSPLCNPRSTPSPHARTFCMATCDSNSDCRSGYECVDIKDHGDPWGASLIDTDRGNKGCLVPVTNAPSASKYTGDGDGGEPGVCTAEAASDASSAGGAGG
ncbi:MAG TPA: hypothetical protein VHB79_08390 [Polyangiaceae bacterium]|nr:hypothetical protein [Polyangiaceae bacterium]